MDTRIKGRNQVEERWIKEPWKNNIQISNAMLNSYLSHNLWPNFQCGNFRSKYLSFFHSFLLSFFFSFFLFSFFLSLILILLKIESCKINIIFTGIMKPIDLFKYWNNFLDNSQTIIITTTMAKSHNFHSCWDTNTVQYQTGLKFLPKLWKKTVA